jgi:BolA protein
MQFEVLHGARIIRGMSDTSRLDRLRACLQSALEPDLLEIRDDSALHAGHAGAREGGHFHVLIRSARFVGLAPLARHRLVYAAVTPLMGRDIHALSIDARLPS